MPDNIVETIQASELFKALSIAEYGNGRTEFSWLFYGYDEISSPSYMLVVTSWSNKAFVYCWFTYPDRSPITLEYLFENCNQDLKDFLIFNFNLFAKEVQHVY